MSLFTLAIILGLIAVNAGYVAAEFAAVSARRSRIRQRAEQGSGAARHLLPILEDPQRLDRYIAACQIGITFSSLVLGAVGQATLALDLRPALERWFDLEALAAQTLASAVVLVGLSGSQMLLGELVPKSIALQYPTQTALATILPMRWSLRALAWFIAILNGSGVRMLRMMRVPQGSHRHVHSPEEIALLFAESRAGGVFKPEEYRRLRRALHLSEIPVRRLMVPRTRIEAVDLDSPFDQVLEQVRATPYTRLAAYRDSLDQISGVVHSRDILLEHLRHGPAASLARIVRPVVTVPDSLTADRLLSRLKEAHAQMAVVLDEFGGVAGLVTVSDVFTEVMGSIPDERAAPGQHGTERLSDGRLKLAGTARMDDLDPVLASAWPGKAATVGGRVTELLGRLPLPGERLTLAGIEVEIAEASRQAVQTVIVSLPGQSAAGSAG